jgi:hypothetical protein
MGTVLSRNAEQDATYQELLSFKETMAFWKMEGDMVSYNVERKREFRHSLAASLIDLLSVAEFRTVDDAYLLALEAENAVEEFCNSGKQPTKANIVIHDALEEAATSAWHHFREVLAKVLGRPVPKDDLSF